MKLSNLFDQGKFVVTGEVGPVKGAIPRDNNFIPPCMKEAEYLKGHVHAINVTDNQTAVVRMASMAVCRLLLDMGIEPNLQMVCRDRK